MLVDTNLGVVFVAEDEERGEEAKRKKGASLSLLLLAHPRSADVKICLRCFTAVLSAPRNPNPKKCLMLRITRTNECVSFPHFLNEKEKRNSVVPRKFHQVLVGLCPNQPEVTSGATRRRRRLQHRLVHAVEG